MITPDAPPPQAASLDAVIALEHAYRNELRRVRASLIRLLGNFDAVEEALHEAFAAAAERWPREGVPANPYAWLVSAGRFKTIDRWRREARLSAALPEMALLAEPAFAAPFSSDADHIEDDELRLIFICCHPALPADARIALCLREVCGLTTEEIARAYLTRASTIAQRIVRAKAKIRDDAIAYEVPPPSERSARLESVLQVVYLIFNEGYATTAGNNLTRTDLCAEAIRLGTLIVELMDDPEARGLLALMLLHESRREARVDAAGDLILLEHQDRTRWDANRIQAARVQLDHSLQSRRIGPYALQAAIAATHADAEKFDDTDWHRIVAFYDLLIHADPSPVVALNRAVALVMRDGPAAGLAAIDAVMAKGGLDDYPLAHAARADVLRRLGRVEEARAAYVRALGLSTQPAQRRFIDTQLAKLAEWR